MRWLLLLSVLVVSACAPDGCKNIAIKDYDKTFEQKLTDEIRAAGKDDVWPQTVLDYRSLRSAVRGCRGVLTGVK